jgi:hypothetical protein
MSFPCRRGGERDGDSGWAGGGVGSPGVCVGRQRLRGGGRRRVGSVLGFNRERAGTTTTGVLPGSRDRQTVHTWSAWRGSGAEGRRGWAGAVRGRPGLAGRQPAAAGWRAGVTGGPTLPRPVDDYGDDYGSRVPPVISFSRLSPTTAFSLSRASGDRRRLVLRASPRHVRPARPPIVLVLVVVAVLVLDSPCVRSRTRTVRCAH